MNSLRVNGLRRLLSLALLTFSISYAVDAQDYSEQIGALKRSFVQRDLEHVTPFLSTKLTFAPAKTEDTPVILASIFKGLPLHNLSIVRVEGNKAKVSYDFGNMKERLPKRILAYFNDSYVHFDGDGKIIGIDAIQAIVKVQMEDAERGVKAPNPGDLEEKYSFETIEFPSADGLIITADLYEVAREAPVILLCHQGGANRHEYLDIARRLNQMGFNCLAIDQRSGGDFLERPNLTYQRAKEKNLPTEFRDAQKDINAAVEFLNAKYERKVVVVGSSYSASLTLVVAKSNPNIKALIAFSPSGSLNKTITKIEVPFLITSSREEADDLTERLIGETVLKDGQSQYIPETMGFHGASTLWNGQEGAEEYWKEIKKFLFEVYPELK